MNLAKSIFDACVRYDTKPGVIFEGLLFTFADIARNMQQYASMLRGLGVSPGDRVAVQLRKSMEFIFLHLAIMAAGGCSLPLNPEYKPEELEYFLSDSRSSLFFTDQEDAAKAAGALGKLPDLCTVVSGRGSICGAASLEEELEGANTDFEPDYPTGDDDTAVICYTSGTTGRSKGAMITHRNLVSNMHALKQAWQISHRDRLLHVLPLFHVHGLFVALQGALHSGCTTVMHRKFEPTRCWETIESERCSLFMAVPTIYQRLMNTWDVLEPKPNLEFMRLFISGSAPLLENQFHRFEELTGFRILERYGMTEAGMITSNLLDPAGRIARSVGYALPGVEIRVVESGGRDAAPGQVGEVCIRGDNVFSGYWDMPEKTRETFAGDWLKSGDLGYLDPNEQGRLFLVGRAKELIITGGYNVYPKEIENLLDSHFAVRESAVIGLPDDDFGERVTAVVALKEEEGAFPPESLIHYCREHLIGYKCPKQVILTDRLPRNAMGKLQKTRLLEQYASDSK